VQNIIEPTPFKEITNSYHYIQLIQETFYDKLREEKMYSHFMQDNGTGHTEKKKRYLANSKKFVDYGLLDLHI
jgi:truncated hemoglobin YjbI